LNKQNELIGNWIKTETELELVKTLSHKKIAHFTKEDMASLVEVMAKWKVLLGATNEATSEELILICQFIYDNFKKFTLEDIKIAMNWSISGKIDMSFVSTKTISALYVSKALQLYENEKKNVINKIAEEKLLYERKKSRDEVIIATPEEKANTFKTILIDVYSDYKNNGNFFDFGDFVYNWIKENKILIPTKQQVIDAMIYGEQKLREYKYSENKEQTKIISKFLESQSDESKKKKFAREYIITKFFIQIKDITHLLSYLKLEQFKNK
jgi:hypothetical protein